MIDRKIDGLENDPRRLIREMCQNGMDCRDEKCMYAHKIYDLDFVPNEQYISNLQRAREGLEIRLKQQSNTP